MSGGPGDPSSGPTPHVTGSSCSEGPVAPVLLSHLPMHKYAQVARMSSSHDAAKRVTQERTALVTRLLLAFSFALSFVSLALHTFTPLEPEGPWR